MRKVLKDTRKDTEETTMSDFPVSEYQDGWCFRSDFKDANGVRRQVRRKFATERLAIEGYLDFLKEREAGAKAASAAMTFSDAVTWWIQILKDEGRALTTLEGHRVCLDLYAIPKLGKVPLANVSADLLRETYRELADRGLSTSTIASISRRIRALMSRAVAEGKLKENTAKLVKPPKGKPPKKHVILTPEELVLLLNEVRQDRLAACWILGIFTGMRRGELAGLRWDSVDFGERTISINWQIAVGSITGAHATSTKTEASERELARLPAIVFEALADWKVRQVTERMALGKRWEADNYVFTTRDGTTYDPGSLSERIKVLCKKAGVPAVPLHMLRHTLATNTIKAGISTDALAPFLGHANGAITAKFYRHVSPEMASDMLTPYFDRLAQ
jgi:integrase